MSLRVLLDHRRAVRAGQLALVLATCASALGFAGALWWGFDLFAHFRPQYFVAGVLLAALLAFTRHPWWAAVALVVAAVNAVPVVALYREPAQAAQPGAAQGLRLMAFNVFGFNRDYARTVRYVQREQPDVLVLLEVTPEWIPAVRELAAQYPHQWINAGDDAHGIAMMSREPPVAATAVDLAHHGVLAYLLTYERDGYPLSVLGAHLNWPLGRRASEVRNAQLAAIASLAHGSVEPLVVIGDLNITPFSEHFTRTLRDGGLRRCVPGAGFTPTWPARFVPFYIQIDHCLASAGIHAWNFTIGDHLGSDHYPVSVEVAAAVPSPPISRP
jgi:endonuclease/exonuclease/phosphatase (EEP) superfamily protein YafD